MITRLQRRGTFPSSSTYPASRQTRCVVIGKRILLGGEKPLRRVVIVLWAVDVEMGMDRILHKHEAGQDETSQGWAGRGNVDSPRSSTIFCQPASVTIFSHVNLKEMRLPYLSCLADL